MASSDRASQLLLNTLVRVPERSESALGKHCVYHRQSHSVVRGSRQVPRREGKGLAFQSHTFVLEHQSCIHHIISVRQPVTSSSPPLLIRHPSPQSPSASSSHHARTFPRTTHPHPPSDSQTSPAPPTHHTESSSSPSCPAQGLASSA